MKGFLLFIIAYLLFIPLTVVNVVVVSVQKGFKGLSGYFTDSAYRLDLYACSELRGLWNLIFITKSGVRFGISGKSISYDLGHNEALGTLSFCGKAMVWVLDKIEPEHCRKAFLKLE